LIGRRGLLAGGTSAALMGGVASAQPQRPRLFDSHCHIIDPRFPIVPNQGYTPPTYTLADYLQQAKPLGVVRGAIVSGSFQAYDQGYLLDALGRLGAGWAGVTQIPDDTPDAGIARLATAGVRAVRFNILRGLNEDFDRIVALAMRCHAVARWHCELYVDAATLRPYVDRLSKLPLISIDHLGMTEAGLPVLLDLVGNGCKVKATGFGRVALDVPKALEAIARKSADALVFGTDLPSTRARRPFQSSDIELIESTLGPALAQRVFWENPVALYGGRT
jgi:predicted TIM-barrel fold metal-dependent hydrolase